MQERNEILLQATGMLIAERRKRRGLNQDALAKLRAISRESLAQFETGRVEIYADDILEISELLRVPVLALVPEARPTDLNSVRSAQPNDLSIGERRFFDELLGKEQKD